jgi:hypothetical protein
LLFDESQLLVGDYKSDKLDRVEAVEANVEAVNFANKDVEAVEANLATLAGANMAYRFFSTISQFIFGRSLKLCNNRAAIA